MRYIVAVSGGVDSVVLLHQLVVADEHELIVAHFDHGIRPDSAADARFVQALALRYGLLFVSRREELGPQASEDTARRRRYHFLRQVAEWHNGMIATAHHCDDVIESIAINLIRGTGWRGLAVLDSPHIVRPLLGRPKAALYRYALANRLEWVEDSTNSETTYLRNRLRKRIGQQLNGGDIEAVWRTWQHQVILKGAIGVELERVTAEVGSHSRYRIIMVDSVVGSELLRYVIARSNRPTPTRPQLTLALLAVKTARPGVVHQVGDGTQLRFTKRTFIVETIE